jgi:hypothetical protein
MYKCSRGVGRLWWAEGKRRVCGVKQSIGATVDTRKKVSVIAMIQHATSGIQSDGMA